MHGSHSNSIFFRASFFSKSINQSITFKVHGEPAGVSWDWAGGEGCVSGVHSIGRGTVRCGRRLAGPARPVGWKLRVGISVRSGCGGWCRGGIERGSVPRLLWEQGNGGSAGHVPVGQWLPRGRWGRSDRGRRMRGRTSHRVGALGGEGLSSGSAMPCRKSRRCTSRKCTSDVMSADDKCDPEQPLRTARPCARSAFLASATAGGVCSLSLPGSSVRSAAILAQYCKLQSGCVALK